jgi:hypothetical protein
MSLSRKDCIRAAGLTWWQGQGAPLTRARLNAKINRNFEVFTSTDFLAAITQHIPDKGAQMVRYYGWYSNKMRGVRQRRLPPQLVVRRPGLSPPPPLRLPSKRWRDLILRVWHVDPLRCPVCQNPMRVLGVINDPRVVEKMLLNCRVDTRKAAH